MENAVVLHARLPLQTACISCSYGVNFNSEYNHYLQQKIDYNEFLASMTRINAASHKAFKSWCLMQGLGYFCIFIAWILNVLLGVLSNPSNTTNLLAITFVADAIVIIGFVILISRCIKRKRNSDGFRKIQNAVRYENDLYSNRNIYWNLVDCSPCCCIANFYIDIDLTKCNINVQPLQIPYNLNAPGINPLTNNYIQNPIISAPPINMNLDPTAPEIEPPPPYLEEPVMETKGSSEKENAALNESKTKGSNEKENINLNESKTKRSSEKENVNLNDTNICGYCGERNKRSNNQQFCTNCVKQFNTN